MSHRDRGTVKFKHLIGMIFVFIDLAIINFLMNVPCSFFTVSPMRKHALCLDSTFDRALCKLCVRYIPASQDLLPAIGPHLILFLCIYLYYV